MPSSIHTDAHRALVEALAEVRKREGVTQIDLAARMGRKQSYISNIERGERRVEVLDLHAIALALGIDPTDLFKEVAGRIAAASAQ